jgi:hypothetical protein
MIKNISILEWRSGTVKERRHSPCWADQFIEEDVEEAIKQPQKTD